MIWIILNGLFIISFPTMSSAMTSYSQNTVAYFQGTNGDWGKMQDIIPIDYVVFDAHRIKNLTTAGDPYYVLRQPESGYSCRKYFLSA